MGRVPVAIAHDYLTQRGGAERVVLSLAKAFPDAPIYTTFYDAKATYPEFAQRRVIASGWNRVGALRADPRRALPVLSRIADRTVVDAQVMIASSSGWAHGFRTSGAKLVYCHNPARWLYQSQEYLGAESGVLPRWGLRAFGDRLRAWDAQAAASADRYLANSTVVSQRIWGTYGIDAPVLAPPPGIDTTGARERPAGLEGITKGFLLVVSRLKPYKNVDVAIEAVRDQPVQLVIVGDGPQKPRLLEDLPSNVRIISGISDAQLRWVYDHAGALVAPSREDFGLTPLEANAYGIPVVALRGGGYLDTVREGVNGIFFTEPDAHAIRTAIQTTLATTWDSHTLKEHAESFSEHRFITTIRGHVQDLLTAQRRIPGRSMQDKVIDIPRQPNQVDGPVAELQRLLEDEDRLFEDEDRAGHR